MDWAADIWNIHIRNDPGVHRSSCVWLITYNRSICNLEVYVPWLQQTERCCRIVAMVAPWCGRVVHLLHTCCDRLTHDDVVLIQPHQVEDRYVKTQKS